MTKISYIVSILFMLPLNVFSTPVEIISATTDCNAKRQCVFNVTLKHNDTGWKHYANKWQVLNSEGKVLITRVLFHPHVNEQPFTRSSARTFIANNITQLIIKAGDLPNGINSQPYILKLPKITNQRTNKK